MTAAVPLLAVRAAVPPAREQAAERQVTRGEPPPISGLFRVAGTGGNVRVQVQERPIRRDDDLPAIRAGSGGGRRLRTSRRDPRRLLFEGRSGTGGIGVHQVVGTR